MKTGRPTKYNDEILAKAKEYLANHEELGDVVPTREGMADYCGVTAATLYNWAEIHDEFFDTLQQCNTKQARKLINGGLNGSFQPTIAKLMLANHGYREKQEVEHSGIPEITIKVVNAND
jgi:hypothetical protein